MTGEEFYRNNYPKIRELALMDREVIYLLDTYADDFNKKYTIEEIRVKFEKSHSFLSLEMQPVGKRYAVFEAEIMYRAYLQAYKDLGLLEE